MATKKKVKKKACKKTGRKKAGNIFAMAAKDKSYRAAKKRETDAKRKASAAYKAAIRKAKAKRK